MEVTVGNVLHLEIKIFFILYKLIEADTYEEGMVQLCDVVVLEHMVDVALAVNGLNFA